MRVQCKAKKTQTSPLHASPLRHLKASTLNSYQIKTVKRIVDGDTYDLLIDLGFGAALDIRVRLLGVDTPELRGQTKEKGKAASRAVSEFFAQYMTKNQTTIDRGYEFKAQQRCCVICKTTRKDSFGRWLASISCGTHDLADYLLKSGNAKPY